MRLYEFEAKKLLQSRGIPLPQGRICNPGEEIDFSEKGVLKAQVLTGGRQKAGGIAIITDPNQLREKMAQLFQKRIQGFPVAKVLWEELIPVQQEFFLATIYDNSRKQPLVFFSPEGGVEIEKLATEAPARLFRRSFDIQQGFSKYQARELIAEAGLQGTELVKISDILFRMVTLFLDFDATIVEINPLAKATDGRYLALDCHIDIDDDALYRHKELESQFGIVKRETSNRQVTDLERQAADIDALDHRGVAGRVIEFDGNLALLIGGGGASLAAFDAIRRHGGRPANYCEIGGNPSVRKVKELTKLLLSKPGVEKIAVIMNVVSNTRVDLVARGVIKGVLELGREPSETISVFRIPGAWEEEGFKILTKYGVSYCDRQVSIDEAAKMAVGNA
jgi:succinyl-CoA synthetase beta subunit/citryl-CoA synthetase large subunit